jgi:periplasmic protein CpxP/Spy
MMRVLRQSVAVMLVVIGAASTLHAQRVDRAPGRPGSPAQGREGLERQLRERFAEVVRRRLSLSDTQMRQLGQVNDRYERERMRLLREERQTRQALRAEVLAGDSANQTRVSELLDSALRIQRQRLDITEREQRDLAAFMTPLQRARYVGIQDDLRRRVEEMRQNRRTGAAALGGRRAPPI